jgi:hypothetical protein
VASIFAAEGVLYLSGCCQVATRQQQSGSGYLEDAVYQPTALPGPISFQAAQAVLEAVRRKPSGK